MVSVQSLVCLMHWVIVGGLVTQQHNELRDALGDLAALAYKKTLCEPVVHCGDASTPALIVDLGFEVFDFLKLRHSLIFR